VTIQTNKEFCCVGSLKVAKGGQKFNNQNYKSFAWKVIWLNLCTAGDGSDRKELETLKVKNWS
jgi:hypothetical protein